MALKTAELSIVKINNINMKKIFIATILAVTFIGCGPKEAPTEANSRIKVKYNDGRQAYYQIIEVDGVEYIAPINGGITPLIKPGSSKIDTNQEQNQ
jgi:hypothetical protein